MYTYPPDLPPAQRTIHRLLIQAAEMWGSAPALLQPEGGGRYRTYTWSDYRSIAEETAAGLRTIGIGKGDIVGLASETRAEFYLADIGTMVNGSIAAAVYTSLAATDQASTLRNCDPKAVFVEDAKTMKSLLSAGASTLPVRWIVLSGDAPDGAITFDHLRQAGRASIAADPGLMDRIREEVTPDDHCILYLTSGATGEPKMGLVTHNSLIFNCDMGPKVLPVGAGDCTLAFLPSAHITQRMVMEALMIRQGVTVYFSEGLNKMPAELRTVRPTFFVAPPRVWERIYSSVTTEIRKKSPLVRRLFYLGIGFGADVARRRQEGRDPGPIQTSILKLFDRLIFEKIKERLGGRIRIAASGAAPLGKDLAEFYASIGLPLIEGYGLTEGGVVALNPIDRPVSGSIGKALPGAELKIADDGELLIRGETVFWGYYKDPGASAAVLRDGWLHTGDIAEIRGDGYIFITGRKKELIVSSNGKKIYPARIEGLFKLEPLVNQVLLIGDRLPYMTALFTINTAAAETVKGADTVGRSLPELVKSPALHAELKKVVTRVNKQLAPFEQIRKFKILERDFSIEAGELTPTMKLRRGKVLENFKREIGELYAGREEL